MKHNRSLFAYFRNRIVEVKVPVSSQFAYFRTRVVEVKVPISSWDIVLNTTKFYDFSYTSKCSV